MNPGTLTGAMPAKESHHRHVEHQVRHVTRQAINQINAPGRVVAIAGCFAENFTADPVCGLK